MLNPKVSWELDMILCIRNDNSGSVLAGRPLFVILTNALISCQLDERVRRNLSAWQERYLASLETTKGRNKKHTKKSGRCK